MCVCSYLQNKLHISYEEYECVFTAKFMRLSFLIRAFQKPKNWSTPVFIYFLKNNKISRNDFQNKWKINSVV